MVEKEKARQLAAENTGSRYDHCEETQNYWIFSDTKAPLSFGGVSSPVAIEKKSGSPLYNYTLCLIHHMIEDSDPIREYSIDEAGNFSEMK